MCYLLDGIKKVVVRTRWHKKVVVRTISAEWNPQYPTTGSLSTWDVSTWPHSPMKRSFRATSYLAALDMDKNE